MANNTSITDKVLFLLQIAKNNNASSDEIKEIVQYTKEHTDNLVLGRVFGYSVSDYAIATLKWLNTDETNGIYERLFKELPERRKNNVVELIEKELYKQL